MNRIFLALLLWAPGLVAYADNDAANTQELANDLANPLASLISVPIDYDQDSSIGTADSGTRSSLTFKPVIPIPLNDEWNVISRTIVALVDQTDIAPGSGNQTGLSDTAQSFFFSPKAPTKSGWIWGIGPIFTLPTASNALLGTEKWGIGPTGVALKQTGKLTYGLLANHVWSIAGNAARNDINSTFIQPFFSYTTKTATTFTLQSESTYDWRTKEWSVPVNLIVAQMAKFGSQLVQFRVGARYWAQSPATGAKGWGYKAAVTFLFPK